MESSFVSSFQLLDDLAYFPSVISMHISNYIEFPNGTVLQQGGGGLKAIQLANWCSRGLRYCVTSLKWKCVKERWHSHRDIFRTYVPDLTTQNANIADGEWVQSFTDIVNELWDCYNDWINGEDSASFFGFTSYLKLYDASIPVEHLEFLHLNSEPEVDAIGITDDAGITDDVPMEEEVF